MTGGTSSCRHRGHGKELHDSTRYTISIGPTLSRSPRGAGPERATTRWNLKQEETDADSVQIQSLRLIRNAKSRQWLRKRLVTEFERVCVRLFPPREGLRDARNRLPFGWSWVGTMEEGPVRTPGLSRGGSGDATSGTTTCRPARASRLAQAPPTRDRGVERPARVGRPAGGALPCGARLRAQPARPDPPPALPVLPTAGGAGPRVRRGEAAQAAGRRLGLALAGRQPGLGALKRVQGRAAHLPGAGAGVAGGGRGVRPRPGAAGGPTARRPGPAAAAGRDVGGGRRADRRRRRGTVGRRVAGQR